jgi:hypothetical protein
MTSIGDLPLVESSSETYRIISSRYPQISIFERAANAKSFDILYQVESLTNTRLRDEVGDIALVPQADRVYGPGSSWIMAPFTHAPVFGNGGRFNRDFGVFYCALQEHIAIAETVHHSARFLRESRIDAITTEMRVLKARLGYQPLRDATGIKDKALYHKSDYSAGQILGDNLRDANEHGIKYRSVRGKGNCIGIFRPIAVAAIVHSRYLNYHFSNGEITSVTPAKVA